MRTFLRLPKDQKGVILYPSSSWTPENFTVQDLDVLLAIDGHDVDNFGRIDVEGAGMVDWEYQVPWSSSDGAISLTVWRDGEVVTQLDAMPDYYRYPTSWWAQDEFFSDTVELELSNTNAEEIRVTLGLYNAQTGQRLSIVTADGSTSLTDFITLLPVAQK